MNNNIYLMCDIHLYKIINKLKNGVEVVEVPIKYQNEEKIDEILGNLEIQYDTDINNINSLQKIKLSNKELNNLTYKFNEKDINNYKFIFESITIDTLNETFYNNKNMVKVQ